MYLISAMAKLVFISRKLKSWISTLKGPSCEPSRTQAKCNKCHFSFDLPKGLFGQKSGQCFLLDTTPKHVTCGGNGTENHGMEKHWTGVRLNAMWNSASYPFIQHLIFSPSLLLYTASCSILYINFYLLLKLVFKPNMTTAHVITTVNYNRM